MTRTRVQICAGMVCLQNWDDSAAVLAVGREVQYNGFRCTSVAQGITCTVVSGAGAGKGFEITPAGDVTRVGA